MSLAQCAPFATKDRCEVGIDLARDVVDGLSKVKKTLPCRYLYDARGSELFEEITRQPEYYPTRTETGILARHGEEMVEVGSGSSLKTEILLNRIYRRIAYVPIDVSESALADALARLGRRYPGLDVRPIIADFSKPIAIPSDLAARPKIGFFPGSTIGNLAPREAKTLLSVFGHVIDKGGQLIIGTDLKKDAGTLVRAYNDAAGVTAAFNLNLLTRINRELRGNFDTSAFRHEAIYDPIKGRVEMHLVSMRDQTIELCGRLFHFGYGETIHTEDSYKYNVGEFRDLAKAAGWRPRCVWTDAAKQFSVHALEWPNAKQISP
jgi:dimethylhistidine N-methyltransferase